MRRAALAVLLLLTFSTGCTPFTNFWRCCDAKACRVSGEDLSGCWTGCWESKKCGHHGALNAIITRCDDYHYHARFHARFWKFFSYEYEVTLNAQPMDGYWCLSGAKQMPVMGVFRYSGSATTEHFKCDYNSCKDWGVFVMRRKHCCCESHCH